MMYSLLMILASAAARVGALFGGKMRAFVKGRHDIVGKISRACSRYDDLIWFHSASYGEFEEVRPVIEATRARFPRAHILLTFFSPSGYEYLKDYPVADWVFYLPEDTPGRVRGFMKAVRPKVAVFSKGEYWFNYLKALRRSGTATFLVSANVPVDSPYLKWYGFPYRNAWKKYYSAIMVQNEASFEAVSRAGGKRVVMAGDPRLDRVFAVASEDWKDAALETWLSGAKAFVAGSLCPGRDVEMMAAVAERTGCKVIAVPHDPSPENLEEVRKRLKVSSILYSEMEANTEAKVVVVDKVGILSRLYRYAFAAYVGAGFDTDTPHSVVEAAVYGIPVAFGPRYTGNPHCVGLKDCGGGFSFSTPEGLAGWVGTGEDESAMAEAGEKASAYCASQRGATDRIMDVIFSDSGSSL